MTKPQWAENPIIHQIVESASEVHSILGPGLLETVYESALCHELSLRNLCYQRQLPLPVKYKNCEVRLPLYLDIIVENQVIIEVKATPQDYPFYHAQLMTHLKLARVGEGLLINFGKKELKDGVHYMFNG